MSDTVIVGSLVPDLVRGQATSSTAAAFAVADSRPTTTKPAASATRTVITLGDGSQDPPNKKPGVTLKVMPFGGDADNDKIFVKVQGWNKVKGVTGATTQLWVPKTIVIVEATLTSALPGVALMPVVATEFFADTLALSGNGFAVLHNGTLDVDPAWFECDVSSFEIIEILYAKSTGGDRCNCLYGW